MAATASAVQCSGPQDCVGPRRAVPPPPEAILSLGNEDLPSDQKDAVLQYLNDLPDSDLMELICQHPQLFDPIMHFLQAVSGPDRHHPSPNSTEVAGATVSPAASTVSQDQLERHTMALVGELMDQLSQPGQHELTPELRELLDVCRAVVEEMGDDDEVNEHLDLVATQMYIEEMLMKYWKQPISHEALQREVHGILRDLDARIDLLAANTPYKQQLQMHIAQQLAQQQDQVSGNALPQSHSSRGSPPPALQPVGHQKDRHLQAWMAEVELPAKGEPHSEPRRDQAHPEKSPAPSSHSSPGSTEADAEEHGSKEQEGAAEPQVRRPLVALRLATNIQTIQTMDTEPIRSGPRRASELPSRYLVNTAMDMDEDDVWEFKDYNLRTSQGWEKMKLEVQRTLNSFLNRSGGRLIFGVTDSGLVKGLPLDKKQRDLLRLEWDGIINNMWPQVGIREVDYKVRFIEVHSPTGEQLKDREGTPYWMAIISVEQDPNLKEMGVYFTDLQCRNAYTRASASCQRMSWQLVRDRIRRANEYRKSQGITPIDLSDRHYSQYEVWGAEAAPPASFGSRGHTTPAVPAPPVPAPSAISLTAPVPVVTPVAEKRPTTGPYPDLKRLRGPLAPLPNLACCPLPPAQGQRTSEQERQLLQHLAKQRRHQHPPPPPEQPALLPSSHTSVNPHHGVHHHHHHHHHPGSDPPPAPHLAPAAISRLQAWLGPSRPPTTGVPPHR